MLIKVLQDNFGILPPVLMDKIKSINFTETLTYLFRQALKVEIFIMYILFIHVN
jgi:uncharacterized protein YqhQ